ncbi:MAG: UvrB/UvrC motif-containing protein [Phycisphaerae bacterium]|nr:UvrB/UvrC motif-containing protein [Phycisphaerae bacterium]MDW8262266.1 UvrB/UvrC motif-containing protein [Phycisphaerales bacterium]
MLVPLGSMIPTHFDTVCEIEATDDGPTAAAGVPARWVVCLLADEHDRPVQLLCVRNLRAFLRRRLAAGSQNGVSRRVDYRQLIRRVYYRRVDSDLEADLAYLQAARFLFPGDFERLIGAGPAWFLHIDPDAPHPRYTRTTDLSGRPGVLLGPLPDKSTAGRLIEKLEDWFDLCRYPRELAAAPHGNPCAYKEMGRCPAPCDGSIALDAYRQLVALSLQFLADPATFLQSLEARMHQAAAELRFETAQKIRQYIQSLSVLQTGPWRYLRPLSEFRYISIQHGPTARTAKVFLLTPWGAHVLLGLRGEPGDFQEVARSVVSAACQIQPGPADAALVGLISRHLLSTRCEESFIPLEKFDAAALKAGWLALGQSRLSDAAPEDGVIRQVTLP